MIRKIIVTSVALSMVAPAAAQTGATGGRESTDGQDQDIVVTGTPYRGEVSSGGARIAAEVKDLPLSISVLTKVVIEDRQLRNIRELADNVAGVQSRSSGEQAFETDFTVRGFTGYGGGVALNGFRVYANAAGRDPATVERVEFLKGPASVLYGHPAHSRVWSTS